MNPSRGVAAAAVFTCGVKAGTIASSKGSDSVAPTPLRNVRRGSARLNTIMLPPVAISSSCPERQRRGLGFHLAHSERHAVDDAEDDRVQPIIFSSRSPD